MKISRDTSLKNVKRIGTYIKPKTKQPFSIYAGQMFGNNTNKLFYNYRGHKIFITQEKFKDWKEIK